MSRAVKAQAFILLAGFLDADRRQDALESDRIPSLRAQQAG